MSDLTCIELFAGAGGASLGLHRAGFRSLLAAEWDKDACATHREAGLGHVVEGDVRDLEDELVFDKPPHLMWASPPCQAFSSAGKRLGALDDRNGWPWTLEILDKMQENGCRPTWVICENVPGLTFHRGDCPRDPYDEPFDCPGCYWERWIIPEFKRRFDHVTVGIVDAADFGVPQRRRRVFIIAGPRPFKWPKPTHTFHNLVYDKWVSGDYWSRHQMARPEKGPSTSERKVLESVAMSFGGRQDDLEAWTTVRDALGLGFPIRHQSPSAPAIQHLPDEMAPSVSIKGTLYAESEVHEGSVNPYYHGDPDTKFSSQVALDPKHPEKTIDEPATGIRGGGDGHGAPHYWIQQGQRVIGGGHNPNNPEDADKRNYRDLTDEPSTTIAAQPAGNAGPWLVDAPKGAQTAEADDPSPTIRAGGNVDASGHLGGAAPPYVSEVRFLERNSGSRGLEAKDVDAPSPAVLGGDGIRGWDRLQVEEGTGPAEPKTTDDGMDFFDFLEGKEPPKKELPMVGAHRAVHAHKPGDLPELMDRPIRTVSATEAKGASSLGKLNRASDDLFLATGRRRLTVEECSVLQGFPTDHPFQGTSTSRYKQVGNAVCPQVSKALGRSLLER